ncbi:hypothetical protein [Psychrobacter sp.]|uniref:hypothetical protein n=1 Tax=Psychrobacter sp. TaxID=56811 RepID=UPI003F9B0B64
MKFTLIKLRLNIASILMMTCALTACSNESTVAATHNADITNGAELPVTTSYHGTASVTQGEATVDIPSLYDCQNGRSSPRGAYQKYRRQDLDCASRRSFYRYQFPIC